MSDENLYDVRGYDVVRSTDGGFRPVNPLHRPKVNYIHFIVALVLFGVITLVMHLIAFRLPEDIEYYTWIRAAVIIGPPLAYLFLISKRAIIWLIHLYQSRASDRRRLACVFEPSCSEYMILAIQKYGTIRGIKKGINRLRRCYPPNWGIDYP